MIIKSFEINKIKDYENKITLIYGKNEELKKDFLKNIIKKNSDYFNYLKFIYYKSYKNIEDETKIIINSLI